MHVFVWPFTWNGGGGPVGSRYFLPFYALFLVLIPATAGVGAAMTAFVVGALFTAQLVMNPFYVSLAPGTHTKSGALADAADRVDAAARSSRGAGSRPDEAACRPAESRPAGDGVFSLTTIPSCRRKPPPESKDWWFWVKGNAKAEIVLRAPDRQASATTTGVTKAITRLTLEVRNGGAANRVTVATGSESQTFGMTPGELRVVPLAMPAGVPFRREIQPTSYLYNMSVTTTAGFVPFLEVPCEAPGKCPSSDPRFLGAMIHVIPEYTDADITRGWVPPGGAGPKRKTQVGYSTHLESKVARKVTKAIHDFNLIEDGDRVMVGLSGGKDSWALIQILDVLRKRAPINFSIIGVNIDSGYEDFQHGTIKSTCDAHGWECHVEHTNIGEVMDDLLAANSTPCSLCARLRRGALYRLADKVGATKIALGHHADDFIETLLLNLFFEGSLKAMPAQAGVRRSRAHRHSPARVCERGRLPRLHDVDEAAGHRLLLPGVRRSEPAAAAHQAAADGPRARERRREDIRC